MTRFTTIICLLVAASVPALCQISLEQYNINPDTITVSGLSSGGAFATQYHVIYSSELKGAAIFAGILYHCANGFLATALLCMDDPWLTDVNQEIDKAQEFADAGTIDPTEGMAGDKVYIFAGTLDTTVKPRCGSQIETFYLAYGSEVTTELTIEAEHCQPTDFYGEACSYNGGVYINNCDYNGAYIALNYLYDGGLTLPDSDIAFLGEMKTFDQTEFFPDGDANGYSMDDEGYIYIPPGCQNKTETCDLHVVFHGCLQGKEFLDDTYVMNTGYWQTALVNNIILLFPQVRPTALQNPNGCWDWWGYTGAFDYAKKAGPQVDGIHNMINRLVQGI